MASGVTTSDGAIGKTSDGPLERRRRAQKKREPRRWLREVKAILLLTGAGFGAVALWNYTHVSDPEGPVGHLGAWLGWALFAAFGYGGFLLPLTLVVVAVNVFIRPIAAKGLTPY